MDENSVGKGLLGGYRALDLTDETGLLCGRLLGDLGVDVIKIEKPGADTDRYCGPFYKDIHSREKSLHWFCYNASKRGITLDIQHTEGKKIFKKLISSYDIVIESSEPGFMEEIGLGYECLEQINNKIIMASITPFGQKGPYSKLMGSDLVIAALSGYMSLCGDPDRPPVRIGFAQSYLHAAAGAAGAVVTALIYRGLNGRGQHIDIAAQASLFNAMTDAPACWVFEGENPCRMGAYRKRPGTKYVAPTIYKCKDGYIYHVMYGKTVGERGNRALMEWMDSEGFADDFLRAIDWKNFDPWDADVDQEYMDQVLGPLTRFFESHTKQTLFQGGLKRHIMLFPLSTTEDIANNAHLAARGYWAELNHSELGATIRYPGAFVKTFPESSGLRIRAPLGGEHNMEIYRDELGLSMETIMDLQKQKVI